MPAPRIPVDSPAARNALLVEHVRCARGDRVLDLSLYGRVGHGVAPLAIALKRAYPQAVVAGLYSDRRVAERIRQQVVASGLAIEVHEGSPIAPEFPPRSFQRVVTALLFHHLGTEDKRRVLSRMHELLTEGGELHVLDWAQLTNPLLRLMFLGVRMTDGFASTADNVNGRLPALMKEAGFHSVVEIRREVALPGVLALYRAAV
jgi:cyclopropane fatty-acyl-phospholipid synthase-like methyltransferase